jgi:Glycosyltransferase family 87
MKQSSISPQKWILLISLVISTMMLAFTAHAFKKAARGDLCDFQAYYVAAKALCEHNDPYVFAERPYIYPPLFATLCMPLALLPANIAAMAYVPVMVAAILLSFSWGVREILRRFNVPVTPLLFGITLLISFAIMEDRIKSDLQMFQVNSLLLFLLVLSLRWLDRRPFLAGAALGLAMNIKAFPIIMLPYLLFRRRYRSAASMVITTIAFGLLPAGALGWKTNLQYLAQSSGGFLSLLGIQTGVHQKAQIKDVTASYSVSLPSGIVRMVGPGHELLAWAAVGTIFLAIIVFGAWVYRRGGIPRLHWPDASQQQQQPWQALIALEWAVLIALALIFSPQTNSRHLLMLAPLPMLGAAMLVKSFPKPGWIWVLTGTALAWASITLPPGSFRISFLHTAHVFWQFVGGPSWILLAAIPPLLWGAIRVVKSLTPDESVIGVTPTEFRTDNACEGAKPTHGDNGDRET